MNEYVLFLLNYTVFWCFSAWFLQFLLVQVALKLDIICECLSDTYCLLKISDTMGSGRTASCFPVLCVVRRTVHRWDGWRVEGSEACTNLACFVRQEIISSAVPARLLSYESLQSVPATNILLFAESLVITGRSLSPPSLSLSLSVSIQALCLWVCSGSARPSTVETGTVPRCSCPRSGSLRCSSSSWASFPSPSPVVWWRYHAATARPRDTHGGSPSRGVRVPTLTFTPRGLSFANMLKVWVEKKSEKWLHALMEWETYISSLQLYFRNHFIW